MQEDQIYKQKQQKKHLQTTESKWWKNSSVQANEEGKTLAGTSQIGKLQY